MKPKDVNEIRWLSREIDEHRRRAKALETRFGEEASRELRDKINEEIERYTEQLKRIENLTETVKESYIRQIIRFRVYDGKSWAYIAIKMHSTEGAVRQLFYRTVAKW